MQNNEKELWKVWSGKLFCYQCEQTAGCISLYRQCRCSVARERTPARLQDKLTAR
ncbi:MAG: hypothetical protein ACLTR6_16320 [Clostridium fessum]